MGILLFLVINVIVLLPIFGQGAPEVRLPSGVARGTDLEAVTTKKPYHAYYGIPFATPPVGGLRYKSPQKFIQNDPNRIITSDKFRATCVQNTYLSNDDQLQSEDCLYLNVFTPNASTTGRFNNRRIKKVMIWIHGGGFVGGSADIFSPGRMVTDYDVIVVTIQYRLGVLGFLSSGDDNLPGNLGLRDQIEAIQWTKDNIRFFGGDDKDMTIFGMSAGSAGVSLLTISPLTKGLFTKAIMQSGVALSPFAVVKKPVDKFYEVARRTDCLPLFYFPGIKNYYHKRILECLEKLPLEKLMKGEGNRFGGSFSDMSSAESNDFGDGNGWDGNNNEGNGDDNGWNGDGNGWNGNSNGWNGDKSGRNDNSNENSNGNSQAFSSTDDQPLPYGPVVDGELIPGPPKSLLADKDYLRRNGVLDRKYIAGANNNEAIFVAGFLYTIYGAEFPAEFFDRRSIETSDKQVASEFFDLPVTSDLASYVDLMYNYPQDNRGRAPIQGRLDVRSDTSYIVPTIQYAQALVKASPETEVYVFLFDYYPELKKADSPLKGSAHALNNYYLFDEVPELSEMILNYANVYTPSSIPVMEYFRSLFTNLANFGSPAGNGNTPWPRYSLDDQKYLAIDEVAEVRERMYDHRVSLWTQFLPRKYKSILFNNDD